MSPLASRHYRTLFERAGRQLTPDAFFVHTYTRESRLDSVADDYGEMVSVWDVPVLAVPCALKQKLILGVDPTGNPVSVVSLSLRVAANDPLKQGDRVSNVQVAYGRLKGTVLDPGPMFVRLVNNPQPFGPEQWNIALLERLQGNG